MTTTSAITSRMWTSPPARCRLKPRSHKIRRIATMVHNMCVSLAQFEPVRLAPPLPDCLFQEKEAARHAGIGPWELLVAYLGGAGKAAAVLHRRHERPRCCRRCHRPAQDGALADALAVNVACGIIVLLHDRTGK